jgi:NTP pyrophosphatase (non-canonical NTP hydrolase)
MFMAIQKDDSTPIDYLKGRVETFVRERNWERYHRPKDIAIALSVEASELLDIFKWKNSLSDPTNIPAGTRNAIGDEMADVLIYLLSLSNVMSIDLTQATLRKMTKNARKYPKRNPTNW